MKLITKLIFRPRSSIYIKNCIMNNITTNKEMPPHNYNLTTDPPHIYRSPLQCYSEVTGLFLSVCKQKSFFWLPVSSSIQQKNQGQKIKPTFHKSVDNTLSIPYFQKSPQIFSIRLIKPCLKSPPNNP